VESAGREPLSAVCRTVALPLSDNPTPFHFVLHIVLCFVWIIAIQLFVCRCVCRVFLRCQEYSMVLKGCQEVNLLNFGLILGQWGFLWFGKDDRKRTADGWR
jgi:hypothetical protein